MTERGARHVSQSSDRLQVGPSAISWSGDALEIEVDEISTPHIGRLRGRIRLHPTAVTEVEAPLHHDDGHIWRPFAPTARVEVDLGEDRWRWQGHGYFDANFGTRALEDDFQYWTWARHPVADGSVAFYDASRRDGTDLALALRFRRDGRVDPIDAPPFAAMRPGLWRVRRTARSDAGTAPKVAQSMLDAPFYCRTGVTARINGETTTGVHEALDLDRLRNPIIQAMLMVRMPRIP
ncbi:MAG: carotenoid 1,2-hydratase [Pseudomonadota bacterium]